jgi:hypothetical protein
MYPILASLDLGLVRFLQVEGIDLSFILKFAILHKAKSEIQYFHIENKKNIRLDIESSYFLILNSICRQNHSYLNEFAGELIIEMFLDIIS